MQRCIMCGTELSDKARFCSHCGHTLNAKTTSEGAINIEGSPPINVQFPDDPSTLDTLLLPNKEQEEQASIPRSSTVHEKQPIQSNFDPNKEDKQEQRGHAILLDIPETEAPPFTPASVSRQAPSLKPSASPMPVTQYPRVPDARRQTRSTRMWLVFSLVLILLIAVGVSALLLLIRSHSPTTNENSGTIIGPASNASVTPGASVCPGSTTATCFATPGASLGSVTLTFSGAVTGQMTHTKVVTCGPGQAIAGGQQYHIAVFGSVSGQMYALTFGVYPYTKPGTYTNSAFSFFGPAGDNSSIANWRSNPGLGISVTINSNGKSGTLAIGYVSSTPNSAAHVSGSWKCA